MDLALYTNDEVSREHAVIRRDPATGAFFITDMSTNGTTLNGKKLQKGVEQPFCPSAPKSVWEAFSIWILRCASEVPLFRAHSVCLGFPIVHTGSLGLEQGRAGPVNEDGHAMAGWFCERPWAWNAASTKIASFVDEGRGIFMVVDGLGGHAAGETAAETAVAVIGKELHAARVIDEAVRPAARRLQRQITRSTRYRRRMRLGVAWRVC